MYRKQAETLFELYFFKLMFISQKIPIRAKLFLIGKILASQIVFFVISDIKWSALNDEE
jgi:hypothetical protein